MKVGILRTSISQEKSLILDASSFEMAQTLIRPCRKRVCAKKRLTSSRNMPNGRVLREPFRKAFEGLIYVTHAIVVCPKHGFSICS